MCSYTCTNLSFASSACLGVLRRAKRPVGSSEEIKEFSTSQLLKALKPLFHHENAIGQAILHRLKILILQLVDNQS